MLILNSLYIYIYLYIYAYTSSVYIHIYTFEDEPAENNIYIYSDGSSLNVMT